jgi:hypothetical protein
MTQQAQANLATPLPPSRSGWNTLRWSLRLLIATGLGIDAYVHWTLAPDFDTVTGPGSPTITGGELFRFEAVLAVVAMLLVIVYRRRPVAAIALLVAAGGVAAVLVYQYIDPGTIGPIPDMYDPVWSTAKASSAIAEATAAASAGLLLALSRHRHSNPGAAPSTAESASG